MEAVSRPCIWAWRSSCGFFLSTKAFPSLTSSSFPRVLASSHVIKHAQVCRRAPVFSDAHVHRRRAARCLNTVSSSKPSDDAKLTALRLLFEKKGVEIDAYIVPSQDPHQSEFSAECFMRRAFISGFTGSAGTAVVTKDKAALWTDGRYFLQAENQLGLGWLLMRAGNIGIPTVGEWLADILPVGSKVGIDPFLFSFHAAEELKETLSKKSQKLVYLYDFNLVDEIWKESRPSPPNMPVRIHDVKFAGLDASTKLRSLRSNLMEVGAKAIVISMLDEVAWLLNLRGSDVPHSPVFYAYLVVDQDSAVLFVEESKITADVLSYLVSSGVSVKPYELLTSDITRLAKNGAKLWLDASTINAAIVNAFENGCKEYHGKQEKMDRKKIKGNLKRKEASMHNESGGPTILYRTSPIAIAKAIKNEAELEGLRRAHLRDAAALAEFWSWVERKVVSEKNCLTEVEVSDKLFEFRAKQDGFLDTSFDTICGSGGNGAIIHYHAQPNSCGVVDGNNLLLLDSGGQYVDGTTDVTRTVHFGEPTSREKECFTRVLQGHIALDQATFPEYTPGFVLDVLARSSLWKIGLDYRHGTGHGVGAALNVHEGPHSISYRYENTTGLQKGMIVSNEPGYYEDRRFGIRIENLLAIQELQTPNRYGGVSFLGFERLTFVPIQNKLLDLSIMSDTEIAWLNQYHSDVWEKVSSLVDGEALSWLWENTRPISLAKQDSL